MVKPIIRDVMFLSRKSEEATEQDKQVITDLHDTLSAHRERCVGMAANMIGSRKRIIIVSLGFIDIVMVNPMITSKSERMKPRKAACRWMESEKPHDTAVLPYAIKMRASRFIPKNTGDRSPRSYSSAPDRRERGARAGFEALQSFAQAKLPHECDHLEGIII